ncbi:GDSL-type esterase/lipase family protein [Leifsonia sp. F6_8S_P_1B]|uniref:GDSL-type esterase/lipase family protein n=1 Tax=Leifsonia williamsii TaxID=3035919 RepID=A0ABT8KJ54_9MICO|nr:GDSL-type esterase/lipase family protein [Leifsonia williamsii]MDN4616349.1 GDSL-type esterase/lipase family protein [Leifsonia williamsii]
MKTSRSQITISVLGYLARHLGGPLVEKGIRMRRDQLDHLPPAPGSIVMLGDSITDQGEWQELLPDLAVVNRGVGGETSAQVRDRLARSIHGPTAVSLLVGTNDLTAGTPHWQIAANVAAILDEIERRAPGTPVLLNGIMPRSAKFAREIHEVNALYKQVAGQRPTVEVIDTWPALRDGENIRSDLSFDNLHLNGKGYEQWLTVLRPALDRAIQQRSHPTSTDS